VGEESENSRIPESPPEASGMDAGEDASLKESPEPKGFEEECMSTLREVSKDQAGITGLHAMLRQQVGQLFDAVRQLYDAVSAQCTQIHNSDIALRSEVSEELRKYQTAGPQRAMAGVFHKLFVDLVGHMNHLDELTSMAGEHASSESGWSESLRVTRNGFESVLRSWGCVPIEVEPGKTTFDPAIHESVGGEQGEIPETAEEDTIIRVSRRGWRLHEQVLQQPQVVVK
jgi:molecular chaperone GrpE (heat shock protein)